MTALALRSLRHRPTAVVATFVAVLLGTALTASFATLVESSFDAATADDQELLITMGGIVGSWAALIVLFAVASTVGIVADQRAHEAALLRTIGATSRQARALIIVEAVIVALVAAGGGALIAAVAGAALFATVQDADLITRPPSTAVVPSPWWPPPRSSCSSVRSRPSSAPVAPPPARPASPCVRSTCRSAACRNGGPSSARSWSPAEEAPPTSPSRSPERRPRRTPRCRVRDRPQWWSASGWPRVVAAVDTADALTEALTRDDFDVAIVDVRLPPTFTTEGIETVVRARAMRPNLPVLILSQYVEPLYARELLAAGRGRSATSSRIELPTLMAFWPPSASKPCMPAAWLSGPSSPWPARRPLADRPIEARPKFGLVPGVVFSPLIRLTAAKTCSAHRR